MRSPLTIALAAGVLLIGATSALWWATGSASVIELPSLGLAAAVFARGEIENRRRGQDRRALQENTGQRLAEEVGRYWRAEERRRLHRDLSTMPLRWRRSALARSSPVAVPEQGEFSELIDLYRTGPFRMVLLGEAGSGKSALCLQLTLALLEAAGEAARVPVLLQLATWDRVSPLETWLVDQLRTVYRIPRAAGRSLVSSGRIIPILDGLDEGPDRSVASALTRMRESELMDSPYVLACREAEFDEADADHLIPRDAEIRISPLTAAEIAECLKWVAGEGQRRWQPISAAVRAEPAGALATALNTRLMLFLLTRVYATAEERPLVLLDEDRFPDAASIRDHLIDLYLDLAMNTADTERFRDRRKTGKWLEYIAETLCGAGEIQPGTGDKRLSWWRFPLVLKGSVVFPAVRVVASTTIIGLLGTILLGLYGRPGTGAVVGAVIGLLSGIPLGMLEFNEPRSLPLALRSGNDDNRQVLLTALLGSAGGGLAAGLIYHSVGYALGSGLVCGLGFGAIRRRITVPRDIFAVRTPLRTLRDDRNIVLYSWFAGGVVVAVIGGTLGSLGRAARLGLVVTLHGRWEEVLLLAATGFLTGSFGMALMVQANNAWGKLVITRPILALRGQAPLRLMTFLDAAQKAGVLRSLGPQYDFSSDLYRRRLVERARLARENG